MQYGTKHPELEMSAFVIPQVPGTIKRSKPVKGVAESLMKKKRYVIPMAILTPELTGGLVVAYLAKGRMELPKNALVFNVNDNVMEPGVPETVQSAKTGPDRMPLTSSAPISTPIPAPVPDAATGTTPAALATSCLLYTSRLHPEIGYTALVTEGGHDKHMLEVVRHHHERLNGSGYPGGLGGAELSDAVRMVTICDIYAAMTEARPYRVPLSPQDALSLMKSMGELIDQKLVDAFTKADVCNSIAVKRRDLARCFA